jgi:dipeptidyl aminopeptidase/acylaminoacyl peptidase
MLALLMLATVPVSTAAQALLAPGENLMAESLPAIPSSVVLDAAPYAEFRGAALMDWHPVRREMLIRTRFADVPQIHLVRSPGAARRQLTFLPEPVAGAWFEPTMGRYLLYRRDAGGAEFFQLYRLDLHEGKTTLLTDGVSRNTGGVWSRRGDLFAWESTRRNGTDTDVWVMNPGDSGSARLAVMLEGGGWRASDWSPDGAKLAIINRISANEAQIWIADVATGQKSLVTRADSGHPVAFEGAQFTPDGRALLLATDRSGEFLELARLDLATEQFTPLRPEPSRWDVEDLALSRDGNLLAYVTNEAGFGVLHVLRVATGREVTLPRLPRGLIGALTWRRGSLELGFTLSSAREPGDAYSIDLGIRRLIRWTESEIGGLDPARLPEADLVRWLARDSVELSGFLYRPPPRFAGPRPVIVSIHGGPEGQARAGFLGRGAYYPSELGVALLYPNIRGSTGYGKTFLASDNGAARERAYEDIGALLNWIRTRPDLDPDRVMVTGGSYGGHMTLVSAYRYADRIRCAVDVVGISHLATFLEHTAPYRRDLRRAEYGDERDSTVRAFMDRTAPLANAAQITKPLLVVQGMNDPRVPRSEAEQIVATVRNRGTPVAYLMARDEGHGFQKKANADFQFYATIAFVKQYLLGEGMP